MLLRSFLEDQGFVHTVHTRWHLRCGTWGTCTETAQVEGWHVDPHLATWCDPFGLFKVRSRENTVEKLAFCCLCVSSQREGVRNGVCNDLRICYHSAGSQGSWVTSLRLFDVSEIKQPYTHYTYIHTYIQIYGIAVAIFKNEQKLGLRDKDNVWCHATPVSDSGRGCGLKFVDRNVYWEWYGG